MSETPDLAALCKDAIYTEQRALWLDPDDLVEMVDDLVSRLGPVLDGVRDETWDEALEAAVAEVERTRAAYRWVKNERNHLTYDAAIRIIRGTPRADAAARPETTPSLAMGRTSPGGKSLTYCCCDRTTARLVVCPAHPDGIPARPETTEGER